MEIIPAIDIIDGKCVRLKQGDYGQKTIYNENPAEVARQFEAAGITRLHLVDLDGAKAGKVTNWKTLEAVTLATKLVVDFGGGIQSAADVQIILDNGARYAAVGSVAVKNEPLFSEWLQEFGPDVFLLGADVRNEQLAVKGWTETTTLNIFDFIENMLQKGVTRFFCTDIGKDGMLEGPSIDLYQRLLARFPGMHLIASGGVSSLEDVRLLRQTGCSGAIIGKAIYEGRIRLEELVA
jgi:phosphoribosylformimino-5-aminoimidazole carboxamide ribotide isomerase